MTKGNYWNMDRLLMRAKDLIILGSAIYGIFIVGVRYYPLPGEVEALAETTKDHEKRIWKIENALTDIKEIKEILRQEPDVKS